jgi:hypothetical protein
MGSREKRERVYQFIQPQDERDAVYQQWENRFIGVHQQ